MSRFDSYRDKYSTIAMRRENGILEMRFHTDGGPLRWGLVLRMMPLSTNHQTTGLTSITRRSERNSFR